jgi:hypothetical protein
MNIEWEQEWDKIYKDQGEVHNLEKEKEVRE